MILCQQGIQHLSRGSGYGHVGSSGFSPAMRHFHRVGIVGCGQIGCGIARVAAIAGYEVHVCEKNRDALERSFTESVEFFKRQAIGGVLNDQDVRPVFSRIHGTINLEELDGCDLIIEAVTENLERKIDILKTLDQLYPPPVILATHSIALSIAQIATDVHAPERVLGVHFFQPVSMMKLVEVVNTPRLSSTVLEKACDFIRSLKKEPIIVADSPGFIATRLMLGYMLNAIRIFEAGGASKEDIDKAVELSSGHAPMGPFAFMDFLGLDHIHRLANTFYEEYHDPQYAPPPLLKQLVDAGHWGRKTGQGFYSYSQEEEQQKPGFLEKPGF